MTGLAFRFYHCDWGEEIHQDKTEINKYCMFIWENTKK